MKNLGLFFSLLFAQASFASSDIQCIDDFVKHFWLEQDATLLDAHQYDYYLNHAKTFCDQDSEARVRRVSNGRCRAYEWKHAFYCWKQDTAFDCYYNYGRICYWDAD